MSPVFVDPRDVCNACQGPSADVPATTANRPGLSELDYRVGIFTTFRQAMLLAMAEKTALRGWTSRSPAPQRDESGELTLPRYLTIAGGDHGLAVVEMWAYILDILTFYQERIANEAYLETARLRENVSRLGALVDYRLASGVAASADLAFTVEEGKTVQIPTRLRVQSVPGQDETPQKFETDEAVVANATLSKLRALPRPTRYEALAEEASEASLEPARAKALSSGLAPADQLVLTVRSGYRIHFGSSGSGFDSAALVILEEARDDLLADSSLTAVLEGHADSSQGFAYALALSESRANAVRDWLVAQGVPSTQLSVLALGMERPVADNATAAGRALNRRVEIVLGQGVEEKAVDALETVDDRQVLEWSPPVLASLGGDAMYKWTRKLRLFGYNAPEKYLEPTPSAPDSIWLQWNTIAAGDSGYEFDIGSTETQLDLDAVYDLRLGTWILIVDPAFVALRQITAASQVAGTQGPLTGTVTRVTLDSAVGTDIADLRQVVLYELTGFEDDSSVSPEIELWDRRYAASLSGSTIYVPLALIDEDAELDELEAGRKLLIDDDQESPQLVTVRQVGEVDTDGDGSDDHLMIRTTAALERAFDSESAVVYANVARATHGETVSGEVLGDGDAAEEFQEFELKKSPLTFVPDSTTETGAASTLELRVDGVLWDPVSSFFDSSAEDRDYVERIGESGEVVVRTGDGKTGARLTTGSGNVSATYRVGIGLDGMVEAGSLRTLLDRPKGLKAATNPAAAFGAADRETIETARENVPTTVRTLGRVVSLLDFEDAARRYQGVAKARASWTGSGVGRAVELTVAGEEGTLLGSSGLAALRSTLDNQRDTNRPLTLRDYEQVDVSIAIQLAVDSAYDEDTVVAAVSARLAEVLAFDERDLGQPLHLSDVYATVEAVDGVTASLVTGLGFADLTTSELEEHRVLFDAPGVPAAVQPRLLVFPYELALLGDTADLSVTTGLEER